MVMVAMMLMLLVMVMVMVMVITMVIVVGVVISIPKEPVIMKCLGVRIVSDPGGGCFNSAGVSMSNCWSRSLFIARYRTVLCGIIV